MKTNTSSALREGVLAFLKSLIAIIVYALAVAGADSGMGALWSGTTSSGLLNQSVATLVGGVGSMWLMRWIFDRKSIGSMGYAWRWKDLVLGILAGAGLILAGLGILLLTGSVRIVSTYWQNPYLLQTVLLFACVALAEETCFRGYIVGNMADSMGNIYALFISGVLFSAPHLINPNSSLMSFIGILLAGWFLGAAYVFTRNMWLAIGIHFGWNLVQSLVGFNVSGTEMPGVLILEHPVKNYWNGGDFGFEASVVCIILLTAATLFLIWKGMKVSGPSSDKENA